MTDPTHRDSEPVPQAKRGSLGRYGLLVTQAVMVLALLNGLADLAYYSARTIILTTAQSAVDVTSRPAGWADYSHRTVPGLGTIVEPVAGPGLHVDALGMRSTGAPRRDGARGVLLGSSQAFGYYVEDDATVAAAIERIRADTNVAVIAGPSRTAAESILNWRHVATRIDTSDFAILLFSNIEMYEACTPVVPLNENQIALVKFPRRIVRRFFQAEPTELPCETPEARTAVVERSLYELQTAVAVGRRHSPHFAVVIAPLLYGNESNAELIRSQINPKSFDILDLTVHEFRTRIAAEKIPYVIDLSDAFDGNGDTHFIDSFSHFSRAGADQLAARILDRLPETFFSGHH